MEFALYVSTFLEFAITKVSIIPIKENIINHSWKSPLFKEQEARKEKGGNPFDVTIGAQNSIEICQPVGLVLRQKFQQLTKTKQFGPYRDDGLAIVKNMSGPQPGEVKT